MSLNSPAMQDARIAIQGGFGKEKYLSFYQLEQLAKPFIATKGDLNMSLQDCDTLIMWQKMSQDFFDLVVDMMKHYELFPNFVGPEWYAIDNAALPLPLVAGAGEKLFESPHWAPVVFGKDTAAPEELKGLLAKSQIFDTVRETGGVLMVDGPRGSFHIDMG